MLQRITLTTDFGLSGGYVAACEATIARVRTGIRVFHVAHDIPVGDVGAAALVLARVAPLYPEAVHLAVVDPGVGTARRALTAATARGDFLVGPDNGLLLDAAAALGGLTHAWALDVGRVRECAGLPAEGVSTTFHGRDLFAPASALLAGGEEPSVLGAEVDPGTLVRPVPLEMTLGDGEVSAPVLEVDRFGNVALAVPFADIPSNWPADGIFSVEVSGDGEPEWTARLVDTYADLASGELGLIRDSWGQAALALNGASAAELLGVRGGVTVKLRPPGR